MKSAAISSSRPRPFAATASAEPTGTDHWPPLGGLTPFTTIDFPGRLAAVLYTQGCSWRCRYCHNSHLWAFTGGAVTWERIRAFLESRRGLLDGVVFSGGEPTAHVRLPEAMRWVRSMGFKVGLHTTGMYPERLSEALGCCDWVGMDVKTLFDRYPEVTLTPGSGEQARASARLLIDSGVPHEFRTTRHSTLIDDASLEAVGAELASMGARRYVVQSFCRAGCHDERLAAVPDEPLPDRVRGTLEKLFDDFSTRNG